MNKGPFKPLSEDDIRRMRDVLSDGLGIGAVGAGRLLATIDALKADLNEARAVVERLKAEMALEKQVADEEIERLRDELRRALKIV